MAAMDGPTQALPWYWSIGAGVGVAALCATAPFLAVVVGPVVAVALGAVATWEAAQRGDATLRRDAAAGAVVGLGILVGAVVGFAVAG